MLSPLSIFSLDQGKITRRHDVEPRSAQDFTEIAKKSVSAPEWRLRDRVLSIWKTLSARTGHRKAAALSHV